MKGFGKIEKIEDLTSKTGKKFKVITIDGVRMSVFDEIPEDVKEGILSEVVFEQSGSYLNIQKISKKSNQISSSSQEEPVNRDSLKVLFKESFDDALEILKDEVNNKRLSAFGTEHVIQATDTIFRVKALRI